MNENEQSEQKAARKTQPRSGEILLVSREKPC